MVHLEEVLDERALIDEAKAGYITMRLHPDDPELVIYNYTDKAQFDNHWTNETMHCRGLIVREGQIVARGWKKFFNYGQIGAPNIGPGETVFALDKLDGSLGIPYMAPDGQWAIATRGSFSSEQAQWATDWLRSHLGAYRWVQAWAGVGGSWPLFEIVYPENRIVVEYDFEGLVYLGGADVRTGLAARPFPHWPGRAAETLASGPFRRVLDLPDRKGKEGVVVITADGEMVKIKQQEYLELHRIVTGLSERTIWQAWCEGGADELIESLPDEWHAWAEDVVINLDVEYQHRAQLAWEALDGALASLPASAGRKDFALAIKDHPDKALLFLLYDGRKWDAYEAIKRGLRPKGPQPQEREVVA